MNNFLVDAVVAFKAKHGSAPRCVAVTPLAAVALGLENGLKRRADGVPVIVAQFDETHAKGEPNSIGVHYRNLVLRAVKIDSTLPFSGTISLDMPFGIYHQDDRRSTPALSDAEAAPGG